MRARFSLFTKILLWFLLSFAVIGGISLAIFILEARLDPESPLRGRSANRMRAVVRLITQELDRHSQSEWDSVLFRWSEAYQAEFMLYSRNGTKIAGSSIAVPDKVSEAIFQRNKFFIRTSMPARYWIGFSIPIFSESLDRPMRATLVVMSDPRKGSSLFSDPIPWLLAIVTVILFSVILWLPLARNLTRPIAQITKAAKLISQGHFDVRVSTRRSDEIGVLGNTIDEMANKLSQIVNGQKRFLSDVSHELRSPLTRIQVALELLEQTANEKQRAYINDGLEEVEHMSSLVSELLSVARAQADPAHIKFKSIKLAPVVERVVNREKHGNSDIRINVNADIEVLADPDLLARALANLLRNAIRYAGNAGPIEIRAERIEGKIRIDVVDSGPGVPEETLGRLFDPFFRIEADRDRDTGGTGLGLAIVKTSVEACQGTVSAENLKPTGFVVTVILNASSEKSVSAL